MIEVRNLKGYLVGFLCFGFITAQVSCFASDINDFDGYYILRVPMGYVPDSYNGSGIPQPPYFGVGKWTDSDSGVCPGITFPKTLPIASSTPDPTQPNPSNEIQIDPKAIVFPYNCYTTYVATIHEYPVYPPNNPTYEGEDKCMVGVTLKVVSGSIEKVKLTATSLSGQRPIMPECNVATGMPFITFKGN